MMILLLLVLLTLLFILTSGPIERYDDSRDCRFSPCTNGCCVQDPETYQFSCQDYCPGCSSCDPTTNTCVPTTPC
jgi:hypothetical protein